MLTRESAVAAAPATAGRTGLSPSAPRERPLDLSRLDHHSVDRANPPLPIADFPEQHHIGGPLEAGLAGRKDLPLPGALTRRGVGGRGDRRGQERPPARLRERLAQLDQLGIRLD